MKQKSILSLIISLYFSVAWGQYWQQESNYTIHVTLDDEKNELNAFESIVYTNNSPHVLHELFFHVWPNAYQSGNTELGKQLYRQGDHVLQFANQNEIGFIDSLDFKVYGVPVKWEFLKDRSDVIKISLSIPLQPAQMLEISTPFRVKIPSGDISRLGRVGESYQITQWYPKPAVYDKNGWNWMSYLTQGEFYSEYGSFDVTINLPSNYVVGATGNLQTQAELLFLDSLATLPKKEFSSKSRPGATPFPVSSKRFKSIRYTQDSIHDFAWFADKRYEVLKDEIILPHSGKKVTTWAMYVPENAQKWSDASEYIKDAVYYYSKWNGDYPYKHVTAVDGTISAGGGMEYPMVTVIGNASSKLELELVIVHEVGHNWFYGILGSNERVHGWMDEGLNTLNEMRYFETKYPNNNYFSDQLFGGRMIRAEGLSHKDMGDLSYRVIAMMGEDQPVELPSDQFRPLNYGIIMYQKTGLIFMYLKDYLGEELFDQAMQTYFNRYKFKHPQPEDLRGVLEEVSGKNLDWLFNDLIQTTKHVDYKLGKVKRLGDKTIVRVKNTGQVDGPVKVTALVKDTIVEEQWIELRQKRVAVELKTTQPDRIVLDIDNNNLELNRKNNNWDRNWLFHRFEPIQLQMIGDLERYKTTTLISPAMAYNHNDKFMLGVAIHNYSLPQRKFQYALVPMYSFGRKFISGTAELGYTFLPAHTIKLTRVGVSLRSFKQDDRLSGNNANLNVIMPYVFMKLGNRKEDKNYSSSLLFQTIYRNEYLAPTTTNHAGAYVKYDGKLLFPDHEATFQARVDYMGDVSKDVVKNSMSRTALEATYRYRYLKTYTKSWIEVRAFVGQIFQNTLNDTRYNYSLTGANGAQDVFFEDYFFDRSMDAMRTNSQRMDNMGGFKNAGNDLLTTNGWMTTVNLYVQLPIKPNIIGIYADYGAMTSFGKLNGNYVDFGVALRIKNVFGIYFPLYLSQNIYNAYQGAKYMEKVRFTLRLNLINSGLNLKSLIK